MAYGTKYFANYKSGNSVRTVQLQADGYSGAETEWYCSTLAPQEDQGDSDSLFGEAIVGKIVNLEFLFQEEYDLTQFVAEPRTYKVVILEGTDVKFEGWVEPYNTSRAYEKPAYYVRMTATCGLNRLSKNAFPQVEFNEGNLTLNYFEIAQRCLATIGIDRPLRVSVHTYLNSSLSAPNPLSSCEVDVFRYFTDGRWLDCQSVLVDILEKFNAQLFLEDNVWAIRCFVDHALGFSDSIEYPVGGGQTTIPTWPGLIRDVNYIAGDAIGFAPTLDGGQVSLRPRVRKYTVNVDLGGKKDPFVNGGLQLWDVNGPIGWEGNMMPALGGNGWTKVETGMEGNPYALHIRGKAPLPYYKTHKKGLWPFRKTVKTALEPAIWWESPKIGIAYGVDESINIGFEYFTEANSAGFLYAIVMQGEDLATGKINTTYLKPETNAAKLVNDFQLLTAPPHPKVNPTTGITQAKGKVEYNVDLTEVKSTKPYKYWFRVWFYFSVDEAGKSGDEYTIYRVLGEKTTSVENDVPGGDSKYTTIIESNPYESDEGETVNLITGDYSEGYLGTTLSYGAIELEPTGKWARRGQSESMSIYRAMLLDRLSMTYEVPDVVDAKIKLLNDEDLKYSTLLRFVDRDPDRIYKIVRLSFDHYSRVASVVAIEATYTTLTEIKQRSYTDARGLLDETPDGDAVYPGGGTPSGRIGEEDVFVDEDEITEEDLANARTGVFEEVPTLVYTVNEQATRYLNLEEFLSEAYIEAEQEDDIEEEDRHDPENFVLSVVNKPSWLTVTFDGLMVVATAKPTVVGEFELELSVVDDTFGIVPNVIIPVKVYPKTTIKYTLRDTSGLEPLGAGEIFNGAGYPKPDTWDILVQVKGHHEGWYAKLTGMGIDVQPSPDPYALTPSTDEATYIIGSDIDSEVGIYNLIFATYRDEGEPDNLRRVKQDNIRFTLYDETYINKATFELWGAESGILIGPINPNGSSAFNVEEAWDVKMIVDGVEHDAGTSVLGTEAGDLDTLTIGPLDPAVEDASYFQLGEPRPEFGPNTYNVLLTLDLEGDEQYVRAASFTINKEKIKPVGGKLQLVSMVPNTTNYDVMGVLAINGNLFTLPTNGWNVLLESEVPEGTVRKHQIFQKKGTSLVNINTSVYTGVSQTKEYSLAVDEDQYFIFDYFSSKDIGKIHLNNTSFRVIITDEVDGEVTDIYQADFSFGTLEDLDDLDISEPGNSGEGVQEYYAGRALSEIVDDYIKTFNVNVDDTTIEVFDQTNPSVNWLRVKDKGITFAKIQDIPTLTLIGKLTAGTGTPYAVTVLNGASAVAASDTSIGTTLWVKSQLGTTVSGTIGRIPKFATANSLADSIARELTGTFYIDGFLVVGTSVNERIRISTDIANAYLSFSDASLTTRYAIRSQASKLGFEVAGTEAFRINQSTIDVTFIKAITIGGAAAPLNVTSQLLNVNLNADLLDGQHGPYYLDRANHTGSQAISTVTGLQTALNGKGGNWGNGLDNRFALWVNGGLSIGNSNLYYNGGNIGVGVNPGYPFQVNGTMNINAQIISTIATGTAPFAVTSTTLNVNLNADLLDGQHGAYYLDRANHTGAQAISTVTGLQTALDSKPTGTGVNNRFVLWTGTNTVASSNLYYNGGNVGVGMVPGYQFDVAGAIRCTSQFATTVATGTAPLDVASTTLCINLNADLLDGQHGSYYRDWNNLTNVPLGNLVQGSNVTLTGTLTNRLIGTGNVTISAVSMPWTGVTGTPTTLSGFGIVDAPTIDTMNLALSGKENTFSKGSLIAGSGISLSGTLTDRLVGSGNVTVTLAASGVTAGTYRSVTVDSFGRVTAGTNPTTLAGYGLDTTVYTKAQVDALIPAESPVTIVGQTTNRVVRYLNGTTPAQLSDGYIDDDGSIISFLNPAKLLNMTYVQRTALTGMPTGTIVYQTNAGTGGAAIGAYLYVGAFGGWVHLTWDYIGV